MKPKWTVMVYMVADTSDSFYQAAMDDITEMTKANFDGRVKVVVHADAPSPWLTKCWEVTGTTEAKKGEVREVTNADTGVKGRHHKCLLDFAEKYLNAYESDNYLLVLWGHGEGIDWKEKVLGDRPASLAISPAGKRFAPGSESALEVGELGKALSDLKLPKHVKKENVVVGFDACLMGMVEIYYEIQPYVGWAVAANDEIPETGWPYTEILNKLAENPDIDPERLARAIVVECTKSYSEKSSENDVSFSASELSEGKCRDLQDAANDLRKELIGHLNKPSGLTAISEARDFAEDLKEKAYVDLHAFCTELQRKAEQKENEAELQKLGGAAEKVVQALNEFVIKRSFSDEYPFKYWQDAGAVSICFPKSPDLGGTLQGQQINWGSYTALRFSGETEWHIFVDEFVKVVGRTANPVGYPS